MERALLEAALQEKRRDEIDQLKEQRKERAKTASGFSGKQKKQQLRARKQRVAQRKADQAVLDKPEEYRAFYAEDGDDAAPADEEDTLVHAFHDEPDFFAKQSDLAVHLNTRLKLTVALGKNNKDAAGKELSSFFVKETKEQIQLRLMEGQQLLDLSKREQPLRAQEIVRDPVLDHPRRPKWTYSMSKQRVDENESLMFDNWVTAIHSKYEHEKLNHFEHNLEVWRELWRVTERATHVVVVTDVRNPLLHIPPSVYDLVTGELNKPMTVVLNKVDLVPPYVVALWRTYLTKRFPRCNFVCFSSRSTTVRGDTNVSNRRRVLTKKLEVGDLSAIKGATEILTSCGIPPAEARAIVEELNANLSELELDALTAGKEQKPAPKKKSRRKQKKNSNGLDDDDDETDGVTRVPTCQHCGCDDAAVACLACRGESLTAKATSEKDAIARGYLLCNRCNREEHSVVQNHSVYRLPSAAAVDDRNREPKLIIGLIGHPNVGKSSVLNALAGKKIVSVSHTPGHTKRLQSIMITPDICICDCPGLVFPFANVPKHLQELAGLYPYSQIREPYSAVRFLAEHLAMEKVLDLVPRTQVFDGIAEELEWSAWSICEAYAEKRGYRTDRRGRPDHQRAGAELIRDTVDGIIPFFFFPPDYTGDRVALRDVVEAKEKKATESSDEDDDEAEEEEEDAEESDEEETQPVKPSPPASKQPKAKVNAFSLLDDESSSDSDSD
ncbi:TPA: hypothetical protein N0F65_011438 [Lagenidium giganteum]|uniref:Guanine nucleotide-binding protein-like 1 n=1 Tax=Lagenidium giganteum TaxID=4803 RepID=A0AAV2ZE05_9STRA|nr:TPA: hypothetical protein N0F65_011438 [Lagenidium giganteum]